MNCEAGCAALCCCFLPAKCTWQSKWLVMWHRWSRRRHRTSAKAVDSAQTDIAIARSSSRCICCPQRDCCPGAVRAQHSIAAPESQLTNAVWSLVAAGCRASACGCRTLLAAGPEQWIERVKPATFSDRGNKTWGLDGAFFVLGALPRCPRHDGPSWCNDK